ncbi:lytic transglycosylase domain-containing protein [Methylosinus sp. Sm6]|uniref:transglycosylase SLT domain-containing protein n=1 Tax=Methylosinus sp. Sm6 TaxID=2866948 RepID=UPI001C99CA57|nr:lytic transglycosylase domain-containing protein [Methylosinus sp. Sm6]
MKETIRAVAALGIVALAGCASAPTDTGFVAKAPDEPVPPPEPIILTPRQKLEASITRNAIAYDIPESLIHAAVRRESNYNPAAKHGPYWGLMQIRYETARSVGYSGPAKGLLDAETNLNYGVAYLANAYRVAEGDISRAIRLYSTGFYYEAKRKGLLGHMRTAGDAAPEATEQVAKIADAGASEGAAGSAK